MKFRDIEEGKTRARMITRPELGILTVIQKSCKSGVVLVERSDGKRQFVNASYLRVVKL